MPMHVLHTDAHMGWGGQAQRILILSRGCREAGCRVTIAAPAGSELARRARQIAIDVLDEVEFRRGLKSLAFFRDVLRLGRYMRRNSVDILDLHGSQDTWSGAAAARACHRQAVVIRTKHNFFPIRRHIFNRMLYARWIHHVIAVADAVGRKIVEEGLKPPEAVSTIHSAVPSRFFAPAREAELPPEAAPEGAPVIGMAARLSERKGQRVLLESAPEVLRRFPEAHFIIAGDGEDGRFLSETIGKMGLAGRVHLIGFRDDVPALMDRFAVAVLPSVAGEGSPAAIKEALARGVPVVATDKGGTREVLGEADCGILIRPGDPKALAEAICSLLADPALRKRMGEAGRKRMAEEFTEDKLVERTLALYGRLLAQKGGG